VLHSLVAQSSALGVIVALAELAIGVGALLGLLTRFAAIGGVVVSAGFLLAVSWHTHPYYLGSDIVFAVAWIPIAIAGAPDRFSLDTWIDRRTRAAMRVAPGGRVDIDFAVVRSLCGAYAKGRCRDLSGAMCAPEPCPVLATRASVRSDTRRELDRREFLTTARVAGAVGLGAAMLGGLTAVVGRALHGPVRPAAAQTHLAPAGATPPSTASAPAAGPSTTPSTAPPAQGTAIGPATAVPVGRAAEFRDPYDGRPAYAVQPTTGQYRCFSAVCTHAGCTVDFAGSSFVCPCHGAEFDAATGAVLGGPTSQPLGEIPVALGPDGQLYVTS
jgi:thiosulfate dehydrogenase [quinone] large subunit